MKTSHATHWSMHIRLFLIAIVIACAALVTIATPVTHASNAASSSYSINTSEYSTYSYGSTCSEFKYLGGLLPARFHLGGCVINNIKQFQLGVGPVAGILNLFVSSIPAKIAIYVLAFFIATEIGHISDESNSCGGGGVYIDYYGVFFRTRPVC